MLKEIDTRIQSVVDTAMGRLEEHGITAPAVLREKLVVSSISLLAFDSIVFLILPMWIWVFFIPIFSLATVVWVHRWRVLNADARREWSPTLAKKYSDMALKERETGFAGRVLSLIAMVTMIIPVGLALAGYATHSLLVFLVVQRFVVGFIADYIDSSIPLPPPQRNRSLVPSFG